MKYHLDLAFIACFHLLLICACESHVANDENLDGGEGVLKTSTTVFINSKHRPYLPAKLLNSVSIKQPNRHILNQVFKWNPNITELMLSDCENMSESDFLFILKFGAIRNLSLYDGVNDASVELLCSGLPNLGQLELAHCFNLTERGYLSIGNAQLHTLDILDCKGVHSNGLKWMYKNMTLTTLTLTNNKGLDSDVLLTLPRMLDYLFISEADWLDDNNILLLGSAENLSFLALYSCNNVSKGGIDSLRKLLPNCDIELHRVESNC